jgi:hypothetical protein
VTTVEGLPEKKAEICSGYFYFARFFRTRYFSYIALHMIPNTRLSRITMLGVSSVMLIVALYTLALMGCSDKPVETPAAEVEQKPGGYHGAIMVKKVEISDQPRFKYMVSLYTADDVGWTYQGNFYPGSYTFYTNTEMHVGQVVVPDTTLPYRQTSPPKAPENLRHEPQPTADTTKLPIPKPDTLTKASLRVGDSVKNQVNP